MSPLNFSDAHRKLCQFALHGKQVWPDDRIVWDWASYNSDSGAQSQTVSILTPSLREGKDTVESSEDLVWVLLKVFKDFLGLAITFI